MAGTRNVAKYNYISSINYLKYMFWLFSPLSSQVHTRSSVELNSQ